MTCGGWGFQCSQWNTKNEEGVVLQAMPCLDKEWSALATDPNPDNVSDSMSCLF